MIFAKQFSLGLKKKVLGLINFVAGSLNIYSGGVEFYLDLFHDVRVMIGKAEGGRGPW